MSTKKSRAAYHRNYSTNLRKAVLTVLGDKCIKCGFEDWRALQVDHVNGGGVLERKQSHCHGGSSYWRKVLKSIAEQENKYQLLCANCNWIKRFENEEHKQII